MTVMVTMMISMMTVDGGGGDGVDEMGQSRVT